MRPRGLQGLVPVRRAILFAAAVPVVAPFGYNVKLLTWRAREGALCLVGAFWIAAKEGRDGHGKLRPGVFAVHHHLAVVVKVPQAAVERRSQSLKRRQRLLPKLALEKRRAVQLR